MFTYEPCIHKIYTFFYFYFIFIFYFFLICVVSDHFFHSNEFVVTYLWSDLFCKLHLHHLCNAVTEHSLSLREVRGINYYGNII